ncbi:MAG: hypothetical protein V1244_08590 [Nitrospinaceae bacterium]|jgi:reverse gyrase|nr:hypothetical protein [Gammaproteobacteria bacterium]MEE1551660.1 hypothetical protein [Nitrospinaceae bacterium]|tara:strand:- start:1866 stop:2096 length:231 start_codon:yes stop_codon:yes gene_type:complete
MAKKTILNALKGYFSKGFREKLRDENLHGIAEKLEEKKKKLKRKLDKAQSGSERKLLKKQLKVIEAQCTKAKKLAH